jgi:predicted metalloendopeptidase
MRVKKTLLLGSIFLYIGIVPAKAQQRFLDQSTIDRSVKPGDDFYSYANGNWIGTHEIPATETSWGKVEYSLTDFGENVNSFIKIYFRLGRVCS